MPLPLCCCVHMCVQVRTHAVRTAHENIDRTLRSADVILTQFDRTREVLHRFNPRFPYFLLLLHMLLTIWLELGIVTACSVADECGERVVGVTVISPFSDLHLLALGVCLVASLHGGLALHFLSF